MLTKNKKLFVGLTTFNRVSGLRNALVSLDKTEIDKDNCSVYIDTGNNSKKIISLQVKTCKTLGFKYTLHSCVGLGAIYNSIIKDNDGYDYYCFLQDDLIFSPGWLSGPMSIRGKARLLCLSTPLAWGVMLFDRKLIDEVGFFDEAYTCGGYEDDDMCLRMGKLCKKTPKNPYAEKLIINIGTVKHLHALEGTEWNHTPNKATFNAKWLPCDKTDPQAISLKNSNEKFFKRK